MANIHQRPMSFVTISAFAIASIAFARRTHVQVNIAARMQQLASDKGPGTSEDAQSNGVQVAGPATFEDAPSNKGQGTCQVFVRVFDSRIQVVPMDLNTFTVLDLHIWVHEHLASAHSSVKPDAGPVSANFSYFRFRIGSNEIDTETKKPIRMLWLKKLSDVGLTCEGTITVIGRGAGGIHHGIEVDPRDRDWIVKVFIQSSVSCPRWCTCTGSAFPRSNKILTAAHCFKDDEYQAVKVYFEATDQMFYVHSIFVHPDYNAQNSFDDRGPDVAIVKFAGGSYGAGSHVFSQDPVDIEVLRGSSRPWIQLTAYGRDEDGRTGTLHHGMFDFAECVPQSDIYGCAKKDLVRSDGGDSGGPWYTSQVEDGKRQIKILGVHKGSWTNIADDGRRWSAFTWLPETAGFWADSAENNYEHSPVQYTLNTVSKRLRNILYKSKARSAHTKARNAKIEWFDVEKRYFQHHQETEKKDAEEMDNDTEAN